MPGKGSPVVIGSSVHFTECGRGCFEVREFGNGFLDHLLEIGDVDAGDIFLVNTFDFKSEAGGEVFFVTDHDVDILGDLTVDFLGLGLPTDGFPERRTVVQVIGNHGAVLFGNLAGLDGELCITFGECCENTTGVEPADAKGSEDVFEVEVVDGELGGCSMPAVGGAFCGAHAEAAFSEVESVSCGHSKSVEVSPLNKLGVDTTLKNKVFEEASDFVIDKPGEDGGALTEAATESAGNVVFPTAFPSLELTGGANAAVTGIETEHNFAHR